MRRWMDLMESAQEILAYHGSPDVRDILSGGFQPSMHRGDAYFFTDCPHTANTYADDRRAFDYQNAEPHVLRCYLTINNPMVVNAGGKRWRETEKHVDEAKAAGHDGIIIKNSRDEYNDVKGGGRASTVYVVFSASQIRPAAPGPMRSRVTGDPLNGDWLSR